MKVGPKGQVVIPRASVKLSKLDPAEIEYGIRFGRRPTNLPKKPFFDAVAVFRRIARGGQLSIEK